MRTLATAIALADALRDDPFYVAITRDLANDETRRRETLALYFDYSMSEGARMGRLVVWPDPSIGAAVWLLPVEASVYDAAAKAKREFLAEALGAEGADVYRRIIDFMRPSVTWRHSTVAMRASISGSGFRP